MGLCSGATELALSVVCIPETISALNRRRREGNLSRQQYQQAKRRLSEDVEDAAIVNLTPPVLSTCMAVLEESPVRTVQALHVAGAVAWEAGLFCLGRQTASIGGTKGWTTHEACLTTSHSGIFMAASTTFQPDFRHLVAAATNQKPTRMPVYEHVIDPSIMAGVSGST